MSRRKRKRGKNTCRNFYDVWIIDEIYYEDTILRDPDFTLMAKNPQEAAKLVASKRGRKFKNYFLGKNVNRGIADYAIKQSDMNSIRYITYWS